MCVPFDLHRLANRDYVLCTDPALIEAKYQRYCKKPGPVVDAAKLHWAPFPVTTKRDKWTIRAKLRQLTDS
jgi:hypothetical protein